ncbi:hypothetical protein D9619_008966 [Psilocybe cf. subviscida]|uniref:Uncharacterized protein n=1 Tax=Psilocybe cf. subviscida TaxID=2480587 RepID=A0A8H5BWA1_9AGAR|nr:hypothetical protein D9619_008966 [Psilocybe cf. subviscida]
MQRNYQVIAHYAHSSPINPLGASLPAFAYDVDRLSSTDRKHCQISESAIGKLLQGMTIADCGIAIEELGSCAYQSAPAMAAPLGGDEGERLVLQCYIRDIADIHVQLSRVTFDHIGSFAFDARGEGCALEYFAVRAEAYENFARAAEEQDDSEEAKDGGADDAGALKRRFVASLWRKAMMPLVDAQDGHGLFPMRPPPPSRPEAPFFFQRGAAQSRNIDAAPGLEQQVRPQPDNPARLGRRSRRELPRILDVITWCDYDLTGRAFIE